MFKKRPPFTGKLTLDEHRYIIDSIRYKAEMNGVSQKLKGWKLEKANLEQGNGYVTITLWNKHTAKVEFRNANAVSFLFEGETNEERENMDINALCERYLDKMAEELPQLEVIEREVIDKGQASVFSQAFNDGKPPSKREIKALCRAFERDGYTVAKSDAVTGEIVLRL